MKADEKKTIYELLKTASDNICGYNSPSFSGEMPEFTDDNEVFVPRKTEITQAAETKQEPQNTQRSITLTDITAKIAVCRRCQLCEHRTNTVPGTGAEHPAVLVVGEGPGAEEDMQGLPFVGPAGKLLDKMLAAIQLDRHVNCYIANIVKCRPPMNRTPAQQEADACISFLEAQIHILKPKLILAAGKTAALNLLKAAPDTPLWKMRGTFHDYNGIPLLVTYHPSALLRDESLKKPAWEDLKLFRTRLIMLAPEYAIGFQPPSVPRS